MSTSMPTHAPTPRATLPPPTPSLGREATNSSAAAAASMAALISGPERKETLGIHRPPRASSKRMVTLVTCPLCGKSTHMSRLTARVARSIHPLFSRSLVIRATPPSCSRSTPYPPPGNAAKRPAAGPPPLQGPPHRRSCPSV